MNTDLTSFGEMVQVLDELPIIVRNARRAKGMSQRQLAATLKLSPSTLSRIEDGREFSSVSLVAVLVWLDGRAAS